MLASESRQPMNQSEQIRILAEKEYECHHRVDYENLVWSYPAATEKTSTASSVYCPREWDSLACWPPSPPNRTVEILCPDYVHKFLSGGFASRFCTENGTWWSKVNKAGLSRPWSNYTHCTRTATPNTLTFDTLDTFPANLTSLPQESLHYIRVMAVTGYTVSLISLVAAVAILLAFKRLHNPRNILHINLFLSYIFRAIATIIARNDIETDPNSLLSSTNYYSENGVGCRFLTSVLHYALMANYFWIFVEGFYLNSVISSIFKDHSKPWTIRLYIIGGWFPPFVFVFTWALVRQIHHNTECWLTHQTPELKKVFWIMRGPITATIVMNLLFFLNIVRILIVQLRQRTRLCEEENVVQKQKYQKYRKMAKATLVLLALYGIHFFVLIFVAAFSISTEAEIIWLATDQFFSSFQGFLASILFCFANGEVRKEMKKLMYHHSGRSVASMRRTSSYLSNHTRVQTAQCTRQNSLVSRPGESIRMEPQHSIYSPLPKDTLPIPTCVVRVASQPSYESLCLTHCHTAENSDEETELDKKIKNNMVEQNGKTD